VGIKNLKKITKLEFFGLRAMGQSPIAHTKIGCEYGGEYIWDKCKGKPIDGVLLGILVIENTGEPCRQNQNDYPGLKI
jgi:hypothetical protein